MDRKSDQVRRYLQAAKRTKSREERKELQRRSDERKAQQKQGSRRRQRDWDEDDDAETFERVQKTPVYWKQRRANSAATARAADPADEEPVEAAPEGATFTALVVGVHKARARVRRDGEELDAELARPLAESQKTSLAVGDRVDVWELAPGHHRVESVQPRTSRLSRPDPSRPDIERVVAANVDRAVIVVAAARPAFKRRLVDRYTVALERGGIAPIVCANKADLLEGDGDREKLAATLASYRDLGMPSFLTSTLANEGLEDLAAELSGRTVVFVGQSGVGKSSLLNAIYPELGLETGSVRESDGKGRHTTTSSTLFELSDGTRVIDTPGVRSWGLFDVDRDSLAESFPEFARAGRCRFRDCTHTVEPDCGVQRALADGVVDRERYEAYLRIRESLD